MYQITLHWYHCFVNRRVPSTSIALPKNLPDDSNNKACAQTIMESFGDVLEEEWRIVLLSNLMRDNNRVYMMLQYRKRQENT